MANATKKIISDQVLYILSGGSPDAAFSIDERDIWKALEQKINAKYGMTQYTQNLPQGETIPSNMALATYEDVVVTSVSDYSVATLPAMPIFLPRNAGINEIRPIISKRGNDRIYGIPMIPLQAGQNYLLQTDTLLSDLLGQFGYEVNGRKTIFTKDITTFGIATVQMKLVVFDLSQYGITDILPIPSDYEEQLVKELVVDFSPVTAESGQVNNFTTAGQNVIKQ